MVSPWYEPDFIWNLSKYGNKSKKLQKQADEIRDYVYLQNSNIHTHNNLNTL